MVIHALERVIKLAYAGGLPGLFLIDIMKYFSETMKRK